MTAAALTPAQRDALVCLRAGCPLLEDCRNPEPRACPDWWRHARLRRQAVYRAPVLEPTVYRPARRRRPSRRPSWWRTHRETVICWAVLAACVTYFGWHVAAAIVAGRLPLT